MQTNDPNLIFQTHAQVISSVNREAKRKAAESLGQPITVGGKIIDLLISGDDAYTAESSWHARRISLSTGVTSVSYKGHRGPVTSLVLHSFRQNNHIFEVLITGSWDKTIRIWDVESGQCLHVLIGHGDFVKSVTVLPFARPILVTTSSDKTIRLWDLSALSSGEAPSVVQVNKDHVRPVESVAYRLASDSEDCVVYTGDSMGVIKEWTVERGRLSFVKDLKGHETSVAQLEVTDEGLWSVSVDKTAIFRPMDGSSVIQFSQKEYIKSLLVLPDAIDNRHLVLTGSNDEDIRAWDVSDGKPRLASTIEAHCDEVTALRVWRQETRWSVVSASLDGTLRQWSPRDILSPPRLEYDQASSETVGLTEEEERELAELMDEE